jgi:peptidyl-tRNA hydrolase, PTH1 family
MKLIVGLGNVGRKYENTRHNVGFRVLDELARRWSADSPRDKFDGGLSEAVGNGERVLLLWPHTLMNRSGQSVSQAVDFFKLSLADLLVICDDFNLPLGKLRLRREGSAGGQKGLADIASRLGTEEFSRLRLGIGPVPDRWDAADFVLGRFEVNEQELIDEAIAGAADAAQCWAKDGIAVAMNDYN